LFAWSSVSPDHREEPKIASSGRGIPFRSHRGDTGLFSSPNSSATGCGGSHMCDACGRISIRDDASDAVVVVAAAAAAEDETSHAARAIRCIILPRHSLHHCLLRRHGIPPISSNIGPFDVDSFHYVPARLFGTRVVRGVYRLGGVRLRAILTRNHHADEMAFRSLTPLTFNADNTQRPLHIRCRNITRKKNCSSILLTATDQRLQLS